MYLKAAAFDETDLVILIQVGEAGDFLGKDDGVLDGFVQEALKPLPAYLAGLTNGAVWILQSSKHNITFSPHHTVYS